MSDLCPISSGTLTPSHPIHLASSSFTPKNVRIYCQLSRNEESMRKKLGVNNIFSLPSRALTSPRILFSPLSSDWQPIRDN